MSFINRTLLRSNAVLYECRRFRGKVNIKRPQLPHYDRKLALEICKPVYPITHVWEVCRNTVDKYKKVEPHNPFVDILAKEVYNWFKHSRVVAFVHLNPFKRSPKFAIFQELVLENFHIKRYGKEVIGKALDGTVYEPCKKLFNSHTEIIFSENGKVDVLLKILKKAPPLVLMAGIVDGRLLSRNDFVAYAELPSIDILRSQVCNVMQSGGSSLVQQLAAHQMALVSNLDQYVKLNETKSTEGSNES